MEIPELLVNIVLFLLGGLLIAAAVIIFFKEGQIEIGPKRAVVVKNIWTGIPHALFAGTYLIIPGVEKKMLEVTLENEPSDPDIITVITSDGVEIGVDFVIYTQRILVTAEAVVKAATVINYAKRRDLIIARIKAILQDYFSGIPIEDIFSVDEGKVNKTLIKDAETEADNRLKQDVEDQWGIEVKIQIHNIKPPDKLLEVAEESASAQKEGERIATKAKAAGDVDPRWVIVGDMIYDAVRALKGGK